MAPKQAKLKEVRESLEVKTALLSDAKEKLRRINEKVAELKAHHKELVAKKDQLKKESDDTQVSTLFWLYSKNCPLHIFIFD